MISIVYGADINLPAPIAHTGETQNCIEPRRKELTDTSATSP